MKIRNLIVLCAAVFLAAFLPTKAETVGEHFQRLYAINVVESIITPYGSPESLAALNRAFQAQEYLLLFAPYLDNQYTGPDAFDFDPPAVNPPAVRPPEPLKVSPPPRTVTPPKAVTPPRAILIYRRF
jgi:hypothetical protein